MPKEIVITNAYKEHLVGNLHTADTKDLVIVCHGLGWDKDNELIIAICKSFQEKEGLNSFRFNFSGTKQSEGKPENSYYTKQASDLCSVIDYFSIRGYQIKSILGHSIGATATIIQAAKDRRIASIILIAPRIKPSNSIIVKEIIESGKTLSEAIESTETIYSVEIRGKTGKGRRTYRFSKRYLEELRDIDIVGYLKQVKIPTLILRGTKDDVVPKEEVEEACKANKVVRHISINGAGHTFKNSKDRDKLKSEILQWYEFINKIRRKINVIGLAVCVIAVGSIPIALNRFCPLHLPLPIDYAMSWVILTLFSVITLTYVEFINRLRNIFIRKKGDLKTRDYRFWSAVAWQKILLSWTGLVLFITIFSLTFRIILLSLIPNLLCKNYPECLSKQAIYYLDYLLISSFIVGFFMRGWLYIEAHWKDFWHNLKEYYYGRV
jgi:pimeloyl-ACP methyl ester carboxylesterase